MKKRSSKLGHKVKLPNGYAELLIILKKNIIHRFGSLYQFAHRYNISESKLSRMFSGKTVPRADFLVEIITILDN